ncbi:leupaxin-like isoform X1 [Pomacea canaliculata]|uniref:leupaxin-like isoform X1 n=1 Tax=Pomacea canaliculata TaxID=400727 RepID=UPI000D72D49F|nr:leupaxin-like isoform X1 [Pomacea canaliculata]
MQSEHDTQSAKDGERTYTKRVMDDLDALLADLQSTTQHISYQHSHPPQPSSYQQYHHHHQQHPYAYSSANDSPYGSGPRIVVRKSDSSASSQDSRESTPPLPPPPALELLDSVPAYRTPDPIYEPQTFHVREATPSSDSSDSRALTGFGVAEDRPRMSALSSNLSELDQLLQDLNSAQFLAEVDRKSVSTRGSEPSVVNGVSNSVVIGSSSGGGRGPPPVAPKPTKPTERATVESLLEELESSVPPVQSHGYQEITTTRTASQHSYQTNAGPHEIQQAVSLTPASHGQHLPHQAASTATKELDDLMASLSEFKMQSTTGQADNSWVQSEPAYAKPVKSRSLSSQSPTSPPSSNPMSPVQTTPASNLDTMLGDLQSDLNRQGVNIKKKGVCAACNKPIVGQVIAALGKTWHVEHFVCAHCEQPLGTSNFYERDSLAYCEVDYHNLFAPRCAYCNGPIVDKCITALEKMWHPEHFFCAQCGRQFGDEDFHEKNGKAYCREDYFQMFAPKCGGCGMPIMENYISALNRQWHPQCFACWECQAPFGTGSFYDHEGLPYCETHYHAKKGSLCASCQKPITGRCITAMFKKFHPEHFVCAFCLKQLNKGTFKEQNDKPYCHPCFVKLFG